MRFLLNKLYQRQINNDNNRLSSIENHYAETSSN